MVPRVVLHFVTNSSALINEFQLPQCQILGYISLRYFMFGWLSCSMWERLSHYFDRRSSGDFELGIFNVCCNLISLKTQYKPYTFQTGSLSNHHSISIIVLNSTKQPVLRQSICQHVYVQTVSTVNKECRQDLSSI